MSVCGETGESSGDMEALGKLISVFGQRQVILLLLQNDAIITSLPADEPLVVQHYQRKVISLCFSHTKSKTFIIVYRNLKKGPRFLDTLYDCIKRYLASKVGEKV